MPTPGDQISDMVGVYVYINKQVNKGANNKQTNKINIELIIISNKKFH